MTNRPRLQALLSDLQGQSHNDPHNDAVRRVLRLRAGNVCEYCLRRTTNPFHVDHTIPPTRWQGYVAGRIAGITPVPGRRGPDHLDNFAWCCALCNGSKLQRVAARINERNHRLFDPRYDNWSDHFAFTSHYLVVIGLTPIGLATERVFNSNGGGLDGPLATRYEEIVTKRYPPAWAHEWLM